MKTLSFNILIVVLLGLAMPSVAFAAKVFFEGSNSVSRGGSFLVEVFIDTVGESVNAVEGKVIFPSNLLTLKEIRDGNSSINFWIEKPESIKSGEIFFSGITTGGFLGDRRLLFGIVFEGKTSGNSSVALRDIQVLKNDGAGTKVNTVTNTFPFSISASGAPNTDVLDINDNNPPEDFVPFVGSDPEIFEGQYFVVFSTVDKGAGIDHYEVREGLLGDYKSGESPYLLEDQSLGKNIYVKALDKAGNERVAMISAPKGGLWLELGILLVIILSVCFFLPKRIWSRFLRR